MKTCLAGHSDDVARLPCSKRCFHVASHLLLQNVLIILCASKIIEPNKNIYSYIRCWPKILWLKHLNYLATNIVRLFHICLALTAPATFPNCIFAWVCIISIRMIFQFREKAAAARIQKGWQSCRCIAGRPTLGFTHNFKSKICIICLLQKLHGKCREW